MLQKLRRETPGPTLADGVRKECPSLLKGKWGQVLIEQLSAGSAGSEELVCATTTVLPTVPEHCRLDVTFDNPTPEHSVVSLGPPWQISHCGWVDHYSVACLPEVSRETG